MKLILVIGLLLSQIALAQTQGGETLIVHLPNIQNSKGNLVYAFYADEVSFNVRKNEYRAGVIKAVKGQFQINVSGFSPGFYAFTVFHDENENGELDFWWKVPLEYVGISNINGKIKDDPKWDEVKFEIKKNTLNEISVRMVNYNPKRFL